MGHERRCLHYDPGTAAYHAAGAAPQGPGPPRSGARLSLRTPPVSADRNSGIPRGVVAPVFPTWFVCEQVETITSGSRTVRRRRLVRWQDLDTKGRRRFNFDDGRKSDVTPIRFVCACEKGHLQDIEWRWVVHGDVQCQEPMWVEEKGTSADPADTSIVCDCGRSLSLQDAFQPGRLGKCRGDRPWLLDRDPNGCGDNLKLLTRTATNTYFPQVYTVISLPSEEDELTRSGSRPVRGFGRGPVGRGRRPGETLQSQGLRDPRLLCRRGHLRSPAADPGRGEGRWQPVAEALGVRCFRLRTPGDRPESSLGEALRADACPATPGQIRMPGLTSR